MCVYPRSASERDFAHGMPCNRVCEPAFVSHLSRFCLQARAPPGSARLESKVGVFQEAHLSDVPHSPLFHHHQALASAALESKSMRNDTCWGWRSFKSHDYT